MELKEFFRENPKAALAFSGGVDSAYLLCTAVSCGADVRPYYVKSQFQPEFELNDAKRLAEQLGVGMEIIRMDALSCEDVRTNPPERCYHCKKRIMSAIIERATLDGYMLLLDGTNATDDAGDRPGMRALRELEVRSPLRECGLDKGTIRRLSREAGLFTWDKPAYACLATRIQAGEELSAEKLTRVEISESLLFGIGFSDLRVRTHGGSATLQFIAEQLPTALKRQEELIGLLSPYFSEIRIDPQGRAKSL